MNEENLPDTIKKKIFEITHAVYRVTSLFPKQENLTVRLRDEASEILRDSARYDVILRDSFELLLLIVSKIRGMRSVLLLARVNRFVPSVNIEVLDREYAEIEFFFEAKIGFLRGKNQKAISAPQEPLPTSMKVESRIHKEASSRFLLAHQKTQNSKELLNENKIQKKNPERYKLIVDVLDKKDKASIKDIAMSFNDVGQKTIQRDLNELIKQDTVQRTGDRRWAMYSLKKVALEI
ncbi:MAG: DeoR family transcriptional regulator [Patescibacteria group bacterium]